MKFKLGTVLILLFTGLTESGAAEKKISLATLEWEPYVGRKLVNQGFTSEIVSQALKRVGYEVEINFMPWARVITQVKKGKLDAAYPAYYSEERTKTYSVTSSFATGPLGFYKLKKQTVSYKTLQDLKGYKIGVVRGYINTQAFDQANYLKKRVGNSDIQNLRKLSRNKIDLVIIDKLTAQHILNTTFTEGRDQLEFLEPPLEEKSLHLIFSRKIKNFQQKTLDFEKGLQAIIADGTVKEIMKRHGFE